MDIDLIEGIAKELSKCTGMRYTPNFEGDAFNTLGATNPRIFLADEILHLVSSIGNKCVEVPLAHPGAFEIMAIYALKCRDAVVEYKTCRCNKCPAAQAFIQYGLEINPK